MSIKLMSAIWSNGPDKQADRFVLLALADYANDDGDCWPSVAGVMRKTCMTDRGIQKVIRRLEADGWLIVEAGGGRKNCNLYTVINPERRSPRTTFPPNASAETPNLVRLNPEPRSPEPSLTINNHQNNNAGESVTPEIPKKPKRAIALPEDWVPSDRNIADAFKANFTEQEIENETSKFRDYHLAKGTTFKDWDAGWRTWLRNSRQFASRGVAGKATASGYGQGGSIASIAARRRATGQA